MAPSTLRWGIISTGWIAERVTSRILAHRGCGISQRRKSPKAQRFVKGDKRTKAYGTYEEMTSTPYSSVPPHTHHYTDALDALKAKKYVLCEKPVTCNAAELRSPIAVAKENSVFFMEALWTRFQPLTRKMKETIDSRVLGFPVVVHAKFSNDFGIDKLPLTHRVLDPELGEKGPPRSRSLSAHQANKPTKPASITFAMYKTPRTGVDRNTSFTLTSAPNPKTGSTLDAQAMLSCGMNVTSHSQGVVIRFQKGTNIVAAPVPVPGSFVVQHPKEGRPGNIEREETYNFEYVGISKRTIWRGVSGKVKSKASCDKSILEMEVFDEVRRQGGYKLPDSVEKVL